MDPAQPLAAEPRTGSSLASGLEGDRVLAQLLPGLQQIPGVVAIGLGGSRGFGIATAQSDYDIIVIAENARSLDQEAYKEFVAGLGGKLTGPMAEILVDGLKVELLHLHCDRLEEEIENARNGRFTRNLNPLHILGFLSTILISYLVYARILWDPHQRAQQIRVAASTMPVPLRQRLAKDFQVEANLALIHAGKIRLVDEVGHLMGLYARAFVSWNVVLFAANGRYPVIDKAGRRLVPKLPIVPDNYDFRTKAVFRAAAAGDLNGALAEARRIHVEVVKISRRTGEAGEQPAGAAS